MASETVLKNKSATLWYHPDKKIVHHKVHEFILGQEFKDILTTGAELFEKNGCTKWLSDDRNSPVLRKEDLEWANIHWEARIMKAGWKYWALVMPEKVSGKMTMRPIIQLFSEKGVTVNVFDDPDEALKWLDEQP